VSAERVQSQDIPWGREAASAVAMSSQVRAARMWDVPRGGQRGARGHWRRRGDGADVVGERWCRVAGPRGRAEAMGGNGRRATVFGVWCLVFRCCAGGRPGVALLVHGGGGLPLHLAGGLDPALCSPAERPT
jgi:hypothetical protein